MNFPTAIRTCLKDKYFNFTDRATRSEFWFYMLFYIIISIVSSLFSNVFFLSSSTTIMIIGGIISIAITLGLFIPSISVTARRLHDINKSGWLQLVPILLPVGLLLLFGMFGKWWIGFTLYAISIFILMVVFIVFYCLRGTLGDNRFGPSAEEPKAETSKAEFNTKTEAPQTAVAQAEEPKTETTKPE